MTRNARASDAGPSIAGRAAFDFVRYASVWEDADVLCEALAPVAPGGRLLSIASAGDNALALLTLDPQEVLAVDLSPAQLACVALRVAAFETLDHDELLAFLRERLAPYKVPREVEFLSELPKSTVLKVLRRELRERELAKAGTSG